MTPFCVVSESQRKKRVRLALLVCGFLEDVETALEVGFSFFRRVAAPVNSANLAQRVCHALAVATLFRDAQREVRDSESLVVIALLNGRVGQRLQRCH